MSDTNRTNHIPGKSRKIASYIVGAVLLAFVLGFLSLKIYLATSLPAAQLSRLLSTTLHQPVKIADIQTTGGTVYLKGVSLGNPVDFPEEALAVAESLAICPRWKDILRGKRNFSLIALEGLKIELRKNSKGVWNFSQLQQFFAGGKPATVETLIEQLAISKGSLQVNGQGTREISLRIFNLATKGSRDSSIELAFEDAAHNHYSMKGKARPGTDLALDLSLTAPSLSLSSFAGMLQLKNPRIVEGGSGSLLVTAALHKGQLRTTCTLDFNRLSLSLSRNTPPLTGTLAVAASYGLQTDEARLDNLALTVKDLFKAQATGTATNLRHERRFSVNLGIDEVDLGALAFLLPENERRKTVFAGKLGSKAIRLTGNGTQGVTSATGAFVLHDGSLARDGRSIFSGLTTTVELAKAEKGIAAKGSVTLPKSRGKALLETIEAPFAITLSSKLKPLAAEIPSLTARVMGLRLTGRIGFRAEAVNPFTVSLKIPTSKISDISPLLAGLNLSLTSGAGSLSLEAVGHGAQDFTADATAQLGALHGKSGENAFALNNGVVESHVTRKNGQLTIAGNAQLSGLSMAGKAGDARFSYGFADGIAVLSKGTFLLDGDSIAIGRLAAKIPAKESSPGMSRYPLSLEIDGCEIHHDKVLVKALSGRLQTVYVADRSEKWLEGTADVAAGQVTWQGKEIGSPAAHFAFSRNGGHGDFSGMLLGGKLTGDTSFKPFAPADGILFNLWIKEGRLALAAALIPKQGEVTLTDGLLNISCNGGYSRQEGLACRIAAKGEGISLAGVGGKSLLANGGIHLAGEIAGQKVSIKDTVLTVGEGVVLSAKGEINNALSAQREGSINFSLPQTPVNSIVDPFVNVLPRFIQEATLGGSVAAEGKVSLHGGKSVLDGLLLFKGVRLEVESQKFSAADINGSFPLSLAFSGGTTGKAPEALSFNRDNYPHLLQQFRQPVDAGQSLTIGKISFGPLELGEVAMQITAGHGITEIISLNSSLFEGAVFAKGYFLIKEGLNYRGDLLINGLSLKQLCTKFPQIQGYLAGRLDGIVSLNRQGKGMAGLFGYTDLWAREGSGEKMLVSKEFLQRLSGKKLSGFFFRNDRAFDNAEIKALLEEGYLTFETLDISHTNLIGVRDLSVATVPSQNRIALDHLLNAIKNAAVRGKAATGTEAPSETPVEPTFKWQE